MKAIITDKGLLLQGTEKKAAVRLRAKVVGAVDSHWAWAVTGIYSDLPGLYAFHIDGGIPQGQERKITRILKAEGIDVV